MIDQRIKTKIVLLEDEELLSALLSEWLGSQEDIEIVGTYRNIADFQSEMSSGQVSADLVVTDLVLPDGDGLDASLKIMEQVGRHIPLVVISGRPTSGLFDRLSKDLNGGWAFLLKGSNGLASLRRAVDAVRDGLVMVDPNLKTLFASNGRNAHLTPQESQIMALVSDGMSNAGIAAQIFISEKTVERVLSNLYLKYGLVRTSKLENPRVRATLIFRGLTD